jgi:hypothetical protein
MTTSMLHNLSLRDDSAEAAKFLSNCQMWFGGATSGPIGEPLARQRGRARKPGTPAPL